jgi:hypothetical protein
MKKIISKMNKRIDELMNEHKKDIVELAKTLGKGQFKLDSIDEGEEAKKEKKKKKQS